MKAVSKALSLAIWAMCFFSCKTSQTGVLPSNSEWAVYEQEIDAAQTCTQLHAAYHHLSKKIIQCDGINGKEEWKEYCKATDLLARKMNRKGRKLCGYTFFDRTLGSDGGSFSDDRDTPGEKYADDLDPMEDSNDYDEFDATR